MADLAALDELCAWMRSNRATSARLGDVALTIELPLAPVDVPIASAAPPQESEEDAERRELKTLLMSGGGDITPFLKRNRAA